MVALHLRPVHPRARRPALAGLLLAAAAASTSALAHEVTHRIETMTATVITLTYGDGAPFAHQAWDARPFAAKEVRRSGTTDAGGRAVIVADVAGDWRFRAWSDDGHGVSLAFRAGVPAGQPGVAAASSASTVSAPSASAMVPGITATAAAATAAATAAGLPVDDRDALMPRWLRIWFGLSCLLGVFGGIQLWQRRRTAVAAPR